MKLRTVYTIVLVLVLVPIILSFYQLYLTRSKQEVSATFEKLKSEMENDYKLKISDLEKKLELYKQNTASSFSTEKSLPLTKKICKKQEDTTNAVILWLGSRVPLTIEMLTGKKEVTDKPIKKWILYFWYHYHLALKHQYNLIIVYANGTLPTSIPILLQNNCIEFMQVKQLQNFEVFNYRFEAVLHVLQQKSKLETFLHVDMDSTCIANPFETNTLQSNIYMAIDYRNKNNDKFWQSQMDRCVKNNQLNISTNSELQLFTPNPIAGSVVDLKPVLIKMQEEYIKNNVHTITNSCDMGLLVWALYEQMSLSVVKEKVRPFYVYSKKDQMLMPCFHTNGVNPLINKCYPLFLQQKDFYKCMDEFVR